MRILTFAFALFLLFSSGSCNRKKHTGSSDKAKFNTTDNVGLKKFRCRGNCQVYELTISGDGMARLNGEANLPFIGRFEKNIGQEKAWSLLSEMQGMMFSLNDEYLPTVSDYHIIETTANIGGNSKKVKCEYNAPENFKKFIDELEAIVSESDWKEVKQ
ncbi:MAG: hypothetical protein IT223_09860 [Crocinitomicaceae bacterium]|nr:hypothetical protein [Crocinitomicaceae bacterium]